VGAYKMVILGANKYEKINKSLIAGNARLKDQTIKKFEI